MNADDGGGRPNVILFFTDQQRWDTLGVAGNREGLTPNLDQMALRGTRFDVACAANPVCAPSRAAILTGRYPTETGVFRNGRALPRDLWTIGRYFQDAGYRTANIGKWHLADENPVPPEDRRGYDHWLASNVLEFTSDAYRTVVFDDDGQPVELPGYRADGITDAAIRFIADNAGSERPFFLVVSFVEPHHQNEHDDYPAPEVYRDAYRSAWTPPDLRALGGTSPQHLSGYYGQVKRVDECLGRIRDVLVSLEVADDTVVAYTADHGSHFKTRNGEYKRSCHDGSIRVPFVLDGPGFSGGHLVTTPVTTAAVTPTLLDAAGIAVPDELQDSLLPLVGRPDRSDDGVLVQISEAETGRALRTPRWKYHVHAPDAGDVPGAARYVEEALYDLDADPYELDNVIDCEGFRGVADVLRARLAARVAAVEGDAPEILPYEGPLRRLRYPDTIVRSSGLRGTRFGHQHS